MRLIKITLCLGVALLCIFYAAQNLANLDQAYGAVAYVMSNTDHAVYPDSFGPAISHPLLVWLAVGLIIALELLSGLLALKGSWDMWSVRNADTGVFDAAKRYLYLGSGMGMIVWFVLFHTIGGAYFQQWQTTAGLASLESAFMFTGSLALVALFVALIPDD